MYVGSAGPNSTELAVMLLERIEGPPNCSPGNQSNYYYVR